MPARSNKIHLSPNIAYDLPETFHKVGFGAEASAEAGMWLVLANGIAKHIAESSFTPEQAAERLGIGVRAVTQITEMRGGVQFEVLVRALARIGLYPRVVLAPFPDAPDSGKTRSTSRRIQRRRRLRAA